MAKEYIEKWDVVSKLIDIENKCQKFKPFSEAEREMYRMICETEISIGKTPAADVVEVTRCGECQHSFKGPLEELMCKRKMLGIVRTEDFCSFGERRDNDAAD